MKCQSTLERSKIRSRKQVKSITFVHKSAESSFRTRKASFDGESLKICYEDIFHTDFSGSILGFTTAFLSILNSLPLT